MQASSGHPDNEAAMLLLGLFDQSPPEVPADADFKNRSPACGLPAAIPGAEMPGMTTDPVGRLEGSHTADLEGIQQNIEESSAGTTLKRKRTPNFQDNTSMLPSSSLTSRTRPDLPHFMGFDNQLYRCICGTTIEPDAGTSIQCESCLAWQHAGCFGLRELDLEGNSYFCQLCSGEHERHRPDLTYVEYIQHLAQNKETLSIEASTFPEAVPREGKRPRLASATGRGGKNRVRHSGLDPKSAEPEGSDRKPMSPSGEAVSAVAPRSQRKRQAVPPRVAKSKVTSQGGLANVDVPQNSTADDAGSHPVLDDLDCPLRLLEYIPIARNLITTREVEDLLQHFWTDHLLENGICRTLHASKLASACPPEAAPPELHGGIPAHQSRSIPDSGEPSRNYNTFVKLAENIEPTDVSVFAAAGQASGQSSSQASPDIPSRPSVYELDCYGVYARRSLSVDAFLGEFRGEVYPASEYERDPTNQYALLGLPKAFVRKVGPPLGLVVDARRYGTDMRFTRSSCRPNACLSVMTVKSQDDNGEMTTSTSFGVFATRNIRVGEEITLPWDWDVNHVIHQAQKHDLNSTFHPQRLDAIGQHLARALRACACASVQACTLATLIRASHRGCGSVHRSVGESVSVGGVGMSRHDRQIRHYVDPVACEDSAPIWGTFGREEITDCLHDGSVPTLCADYHLDTWLDSESDTCSSDDDDGSLSLSRDLSFDTESPELFLKVYAAPPIVRASRPSTLAGEANTSSYTKLRSASRSGLTDDEDSMSMSATSTLTEPLSDNPDHEDYLGFAGTIENGSAKALPHDDVSLASPGRSSKGPGALKGSPRIVETDDVDSPAPPFPHDNQLTETSCPAAVHTPDQVERSPERLMSIGGRSQVSDAVLSLQLEFEPEDNATKRQTETQEASRDQSRLSKKRIDLARFMQETDADPFFSEQSLASTVPATTLLCASGSIEARHTPCCPAQPTSPTRTQAQETVQTPWWKSSTASPLPSDCQETLTQAVPKGVSLSGPE